MSSPNYTDEMVLNIVASYQSSPSRETVNALAQEFNKTPRSIIAKLSAEGVYQKPERTNKRGEAIVKKDSLVAQLQDAFGIEIPSAGKMNKADLQALVEAVTNNG